MARNAKEMVAIINEHGTDYLLNDVDEFYGELGNMIIQWYAGKTDKEGNYVGENVS